MNKREQPILLRIIGIIILAYSLYLSRYLYKSIPNFLKNLSRFDMYTITTLIFYFRLGLFYYCGILLFLGKKNSRDAYRKYGIINIVLMIFSSLSFVYTIFLTGSDTYLRFISQRLIFFIKFLLAYLIIYVILFKNSEINQYFMNINKKRKLVKRKKILVNGDRDINNFANEKIMDMQKELLDEEAEKNNSINSANISILNNQEKEIKETIKKDGIIRDYYDNGSLKSEKTYLNNVLNGRAIEYYPNGRISAIGYYKMNKKVDKWKYFGENGILIKEEIVD